MLAFIFMRPFRQYPPETQAHDEDASLSSPTPPVQLGLKGAQVCQTRSCLCLADVNRGCCGARATGSPWKMVAGKGVREAFPEAEDAQGCGCCWPPRKLTAEL